MKKATNISNKEKIFLKKEKHHTLEFKRKLNSPTKRQTVR